MTEPILTGGCLCGEVRYEARGAPLYAGLCFCRDCQRASGSGFVPFIGFAADRVFFAGQTRTLVSPSFRGGEAVRNRCLTCGSLVFGGIVGQDVQHTLYGGTLDDPSLFVPAIAIFVRDRPAWSAPIDGLTTFETMPPEG